MSDDIRAAIDELNSPKNHSFVDFCRKEQFKEKLPIFLYMFEKKHFSLLLGFTLFFHVLAGLSLVEVFGLWLLYVGFKYSRDNSTLLKKDVYTMHPLIKRLNDWSSQFQIKQAQFSTLELEKIE